MTEFEIPEKYKDIAVAHPSGYFYLNNRMQCYYLGISIVIALLQAAMIVVSIHQGFGYEYVLGSVVFLHCFFYIYHYKASRKQALCITNPALDYFGFIMFFQMIPLFIARCFIVNEALFLEPNLDVVAGLLEPEMRYLFSIPNVFFIEDGHGLLYVYMTSLGILSTTLSILMILPFLPVLCAGMEEYYKYDEIKISVKDKWIGFLVGVGILISTAGLYFGGWFTSYGYIPDFSNSPLYSDSYKEARDFVEQGGARFYKHIAFNQFYIWTAHALFFPLSVCGIITWARRFGRSYK